MVVQRKGWGWRWREVKDWDLFVDGTERSTDSQKEGKKKFKDDSWVIWLTTWVVMLPFPGRGTHWRWGVVRETVLMTCVPIVLEETKENGRMILYFKHYLRF